MGAYCISDNEHGRVLCVRLSGGSEGDCKCVGYVAIEVMYVCRPAVLGKTLANMQSAILSCSLYENILLQPVSSMFHSRKAN